MNVERYLRLIAGLFIIASVLAAHFLSPWWLLFTAFIGANLLQSGFTGTCPMVWILKKAGVPSCVDPTARATTAAQLDELSAR